MSFYWPKLTVKKGIRTKRTRHLDTKVQVNQILHQVIIGIKVIMEIENGIIGIVARANGIVAVAAENQVVAVVKKSR